MTYLHVFSYLHSLLTLLHSSLTERLLAAGAVVASRMRLAVLDECGFTCSAGRSICMYCVYVRVCMYILCVFIYHTRMNVNE